MQKIPWAIELLNVVCLVVIERRACNRKSSRLEPRQDHS